MSSCLLASITIGWGTGSCVHFFRLVMSDSARVCIHTRVWLCQLLSFFIFFLKSAPYLSSFSTDSVCGGSPYAPPTPHLQAPGAEILDNTSVFHEQGGSRGEGGSRVVGRGGGVSPQRAPSGCLNRGVSGSGSLDQPSETWTWGDTHSIP